MPPFVARVSTFVGGGLIVGLAALVAAQPADPVVGTWKLNLRHSTFVTPAPKSMTVTIAPAARGYALTIDTDGPDGKPQNWRFTSPFDGTESAVTGNPAIDSALATSNGSGVTVAYKKGGKVIATTTSEVSPDGTMLTVTLTAADAKGQTVTNVSVYDRQ